MPESINGWTVPDWRTYGTPQLKNLLARYQDAIKRHEGNTRASDQLGCWEAYVQSIEVELKFRSLTGGKENK